MWLKFKTEAIIEKKKIVREKWFIKPYFFSKTDVDEKVCSVSLLAGFYKLCSYKLWTTEV